VTRTKSESNPVPSRKVATAVQMRALDREAIEGYGIPGIVLMENAALGVVGAVEEKYGSPRGKSILIFCGKGNNGGDGFAVARHLSNRGAEVMVVLLGDPKRVQGDAATNLGICERMQIPLRPVSTSRQLSALSARIKGADLIVDAILGTGIVPPVRGLIEQAVRRINRSGKPVVAVDLPTGLNADSSERVGEVVQADLTVTFGLPKIPLVQYPSLNAAGEIRVVDISLPANLVGRADISLETIGPEVLRLLPKRRPEAHKGDAGKVLIVAGSKGMPGAAVMTSLACLRIGTGLVYAALPSSVRAIFLKRLMEGIVIPLDERERDVLSPASLPGLLRAAKGKRAVALGPGIGLDPETGKMIRSFIPKIRIPLVLDADGISQVSSDPGILRSSKTPLILTPHPGEMARLTGASKKDLTSRRVDVARAFATDFKVILVLKGAGTVIAAPDGRCWINTSGNPGMATAGTGDVLTGMITGLIAQGMKPLPAAQVGVYLHGLCGDLAAKRQGERSLIAGDLIREIPNALKSA
jgi:hydroxyethylthiazole kinase-like uncharacterized protein yjeF